MKNLNITLIELQNKEELLKQIDDEYTAFKTDAELQVQNGNKAAGTRARVATLNLEKLLKAFRQASLAESKK